MAGVLRNTNRQFTKRRLFLLNPQKTDFDELTKHAETLEVLEIHWVKLPGEQSLLSDDLSESVSQTRKLRTVVLGSHLPLKKKQIESIVTIQTLKALVLYLSNDGNSDDELLKFLAQHQHLEILGINEGCFSDEAINQFRSTNRQTRLELFRPNEYRDVFDWNGCINGKFKRKYFWGQRH